MQEGVSGYSHLLTMQLAKSLHSPCSWRLRVTLGNTQCQFPSLNSMGEGLENQVLDSPCPNLTGEKLSGDWRRLYKVGDVGAAA